LKKRSTYFLNIIKGQIICEAINWDHKSVVNDNMGGKSEEKIARAIQLKLNSAKRNII